MPIHDWTRVGDWSFHGFQMGWVSAPSARLNGGVLPSSHFALAETLELRPAPGFDRMPEPDAPWANPGTPGLARNIHNDPPRGRLRDTEGRTQYASNGITVRSSDTLHPVAAVLFVSRQDKETAYRTAGLVRLAVGALTHGVHVLVIDLFPSTWREPRGIHPTVWEQFRGASIAPPADKPLTVVSYSAGPGVEAYIEPVAVGDPLPDMPLFLTPDEYVPCPLEATYQAAWATFPAPLRGPLEAPPG